MTIYQEMIEAGVKVSGYQSDLYVPVNEITREIVSNYKFRDVVTQFHNKVDGGLWFDIPFAYDPYWAKRIARI